MELDLTGPLREDAYLILSGLITPRPIALTTTIDLEGQVNAAPFSFFNLLGDSPPIVGLCPGDRAPGIPKDTARNIRLTHEFVVNLVNEALAEKMNLCSAALPPGENELLCAGLTAVASSIVKPPRIAESPVSLECRSHSIIEIGDNALIVRGALEDLDGCRSHSIIEIGDNRLIIGEVLRVHVKEGILDPDTWLVKPASYHPIGRMQSPHWYCRTTDLFEMKRPS